MEKKRPVHSERAGRVELSIWENESKNGSFYKVTFKASYKDKDGEFRDSHSFSALDLQNLIQLAARATIWIQREQRKADQPTEATEEQEDAA